MARTAPAPNIPPIPGMNPCTWIMGGGGSGGGGSGSGKGGGGKGGAGGKGEEGDPNGGGKGAGACGNGANANCTNCSAAAQAGDPVNVVTGEVFTVPKTDLFLPGFFNLQIDRAYNLHRRRRDVGLGWGWTHTLSWELRVQHRALVVRDPHGNVQEFPFIDAPGFQSAAGPWAILRRKNDYVVRPGSEFFHRFEPHPKDPDLYRLVEILYRNRGSLRLEYDGDRLARVIDTAGRTVSFAGDRNGRIASIAVPADDGRTIYFARYEYDAAGNLARATDADGHSFEYRYDDESRLTSMRVPTGLTFHYRYDRQGRCVETWGDYDGGIQDACLDPGSSPVLADGTTRARGLLHAKLDFGDEGFSEVVDSVRVQRYFGRGDGKVTKAVSATGGVTTRVLDAAGNELEREDPNGAVTRRAFDHLGNVVAETDAVGRSVGIARDGEGRVLEVTDPAGGRVASPRDAWGDVETITYQNGGVASFRYDARGKLLESVDPRGARTTYAWDARGNCVRRTLPNGGVFTFEYDYWGRCVHETLPTGGELRFAYSDAGQLLDVEDSLGRVKRYQYNGLGNVVAVTTPDGYTTRYDWGGLGWLANVVHANGDRIELRYNREGWLVTGRNENGEVHAFGRDAEGRIVNERFFNGLLRALRRDPMGRVERVDEGPDHVTDIERNLVGQLERVAQDPDATAFAYDARGELASAALPDVHTELVRDPIGAVVQERHVVHGRTYVVEHARDPGGRRIALSTSLGFRVDTRRDVLGDVAEIREQDGSVLRFTRDALGAVVRRELPGGGAIVDTRDAGQRLRRRQVVPVGKTAIDDGEPEWVGVAPRGSVFHGYEYSRVDEITSFATPAEGATEMEYDARRHLVRKKSEAAEEAWSADPVANYFERGPDAPRRSYLEGGRIQYRGDTEYLWDERGYLTEKRRSGPGRPLERWLYTWNARDQLASVALPDGRRAEFEYDAFSRRVAKTVRGAEGVLSTTHYVWDKNSLIHEVQLRDDQIAAVRTYVFEDEDDVSPIAHRDGANGAWAFYVAHVTGAPEDIVDERGELVGGVARATFGAGAPRAGSRVTTDVRAPGQLVDPETGLHYNRFRYYDPETGHYISPDPLGPVGGSNLYMYGPNPVAWFDPLGLQHLMFAQATDAAGNTILPFTEFNSGQTPYSLAQGWNNQDPRNDTERQFLRTLQGAQQNGANLNGARAQCVGQYPPCPNCHRAMRSFADQNGTTISYSWQGPPPANQPQTITYNPGNPATGQPGAPPTGVGAGAQALVGTGAPGNQGAYAMTANPQAANTGGPYDFNNYPGARDEYQAQRDAIPL